MRRSSFYENIIYSVIWVLLFAAPVMTELIYASQEGHQMAMQWDKVLHSWTALSPFLLIFILHNWLLAPQLVYHRRRLFYFSCVAVLTVLFMTYQCVDTPMGRHGAPPPPLEHFRPSPPEAGDMAPGIAPPHMQEPPRMDEPKLMIFSEHDMMATIMLILMLGMNWGVKLAFKQREDRKRMDLLEKKNLEQQLEYLRYQINPHFFMNTLNNIHALVDIDPEMAKESIVELSKMMRFVLYEGSKSLVPLERELDFLHHYVALMRLRYTDRVSISFDVPETMPSVLVPPLLFITFVENAFKHGVSYEKNSFIQIRLQIEADVLTFVCQNSNHAAHAQEGGVGLRNVRQRLDLLYGDRYTLEINKNKDIYFVQLTMKLCES